MASPLVYDVWLMRVKCFSKRWPKRWFRCNCVCVCVHLSTNGDHMQIFMSLMMSLHAHDRLFWVKKIHKYAVIIPYPMPPIDCVVLDECSFSFYGRTNSFPNRPDRPWIATVDFFNLFLCCFWRSVSCDNFSHLRYLSYEHISMLLKCK